MAQPQTEIMLKVIFLGDTGVGKRSLLLRFAGSDPNEPLSPESLAYKQRALVLDRERITYQLWDAAGQERFRSLTSSYYRGANAAVLVYDVTSSATFANLENWLSELNRYVSDDVPKFLVGNRIDLASSGRREVTLQMAKDFAENLRFPIFEVSALEGRGCEEAFQAIARETRRRATPQTLHINRLQLGAGMQPYDSQQQQQPQQPQQQARNKRCGGCS